MKFYPTLMTAVMAFYCKASCRNILIDLSYCGFGHWFCSRNQEGIFIEYLPLFFPQDMELRRYDFM